MPKVRKYTTAAIPINLLKMALTESDSPLANHLERSGKT